MNEQNNDKKPDMLLGFPIRVVDKNTFERGILEDRLKAAEARIERLERALFCMEMCKYGTPDKGWGAESLRELMKEKMFLKDDQT